eukprot:5457391-Lingulodinium_polyedra.AAC.1
MVEECSKAEVWCVERAVEDIVCTGGADIGGVRPRVTVEAAPSRKPILQQGGRFLGLMSRKGVERERLKP